ncbi:MAG: F0F1 ATP synthase subunit A [Spirochaetes bacterium]|nr:F0F1 ATP synthase subunit A [Spirochaetota bacterium]
MNEALVTNAVHETMTNAATHVAATAHTAELSIADIIFEMITDNAAHPFARLFTLNLGPVHIDFNLTKHLILMWLAAVLVVITMWYLAHKLKKPLARPSRPQGFFEIIIEYMKDEVLVPVLGNHNTNNLFFCLTIFFMVLYMNFLGLIPEIPGFITGLKSMDGHSIGFGGAASGNVMVTGALALISFVAYNIAGLFKKGPLGYIKSLVPHGTPLPIVPLIWLLEALGLFIRAFALTIRLFANMIAGHIVIIVVLLMVIMFKNAIIAPVAIAVSVFVYCLEILIVFIQAYIFAFLTAVFISLSQSEEH